MGGRDCLLLATITLLLYIVYISFGLLNIAVCVHVYVVVVVMVLCCAVLFVIVS